MEIISQKDLKTVVPHDCTVFVRVVLSNALLIAHTHGGPDVPLNFQEDSTVARVYEFELSLGDDLLEVCAEIAHLIGGDLGVLASANADYDNLTSVWNALFAAVLQDLTIQVVEYKLDVAVAKATITSLLDFYIDPD